MNQKEALKWINDLMWDHATRPDSIFNKILDDDAERRGVPPEDRVHLTDPREDDERSSR